MNDSVTQVQVKLKTFNHYKISLNMPLWHRHWLTQHIIDKNNYLHIVLATSIVTVSFVSLQVHAHPPDWRYAIRVVSIPSLVSD